jgi:hypothetical protein
MSRPSTILQSTGREPPFTVEAMIGTGVTFSWRTDHRNVYRARATSTCPHRAGEALSMKPRRALEGCLRPRRSSEPGHLQAALIVLQVARMLKPGW